ncbi:short-chain dehydrogenase [Podospora conica]|nr:short-chain dehydrogenase [Schizothecium conicum]
MEPVTAIGLVAAIVQFVDVGSRIVKRLSDFNNNLDQIPKAFRQVKTELPLIIDGVRRIQDQVKSNDISPTSQEALLPVLRECQDAAQKLEGLLEHILPPVTASSLERKLKAIASLRHDSKVQDIAATLGKYVRVLTFHQVTNNSPAQDQQQGRASWLVPFDRNPAFVGRDGTFSAIDEALKVKEGSQPKAALCGLGGIGKSQIALEYCYRLRQSGIPSSIFWVNAATVSRFEESFKQIADNCGLINPIDSAASATALVQDWLQTRHKVPWLMVVDNADDEASFFREKMRHGKTPSQSIPRCSHGSLLFTTRTSDMGVDLAAPAAPIMIPGLSQKEGLQLAKERLRERYPSDEIVLVLLMELEYIPLAITQAVAFILKRNKNIPQYLGYLKNDSARTRMLAFEFADHGRQNSSMESVAKTWSLSFDWLRNNNQRATDLLCLISFFQHNGIPQRLLLGAGSNEDAEDEFDFEEAMAALRAFSFVDATDADDGSETTFSTHRLVQVATRWWLQSQGAAETERWAFSALQSVSHHFPEPSSHPLQDYWTTCQALSPHAEILLSYEFGGHPLTDSPQPPHQRNIDLERARLLAHTGRYLAWMGAYHEARGRFEESLSLRKKHLGEHAVDTLESMGLLSWLLGLSSTGDPARAVLLGERVVALWTEVLGADNPQTIGSMSNLGYALEGAYQYEKSESLHREAFARNTRVLGRHHLNTLNCMEGLASVLSELPDREKMAEGIALLREVCEHRAKWLGDEHPSTLVSLHDLAIMLAKDKETREEALQLGWRSFEATKRMFGIDHCNTLVCAQALAEFLRRDRAFDEALALIERTLTACEEGPRKDNPDSRALVQKLRNDRRMTCEQQRRQGKGQARYPTEEP